MSSGGEHVDHIEVAGRSLPVTSLDRVLWPATGTTKGDLLAYYLEIAPVILPHLRDRPITLARFPEGVEGKGFFQTRCPSHPPWLATHPVGQPDGTVTRDYCLLDDAAGLAWAANVASVELHPLLGRRPSTDQPSVVLFDLDVGPHADRRDGCRVALLLRDLLDGLGLASLVKSSGRGGLHIEVPLNLPHDYTATKAFARAVARRLARERPDLVSDRMSRRERAHLVLVDWAQNNEHRSIAAPYSLRALRFPSVSAPLTWDEVHRAASSPDAGSLLLPPRRVLQRLERMGDVFGPVLDTQQRLPSVEMIG